MKSRVIRILPICFAICMVLSSLVYIDSNAMSKNKYKSKCKAVYHDKLYFGKKDMEGKLVKIKVFISESKFFDLFSTSSLRSDYKVNRSFYGCKVKRKGNTSYASGGTTYVYTSKYTKSGKGKLKTGKYLTIYGKVIEYATTTWSGYNGVGILAKYIE